jgi:hypothetical protein
MTMKPVRLTPVRFVFSTLLFVLSLGCVVICGYRVARFFFLIDSFVIQKSRDVCEQPLNNRCVNHYTVLRQDGKIEDFVPFGSEFERNRLIDGLVFKKNKYGFSYEINGLKEEWPALESQVICVFLGMLGLLGWFAIGGLQVLICWIRGFK